MSTDNYEQDMQHAIAASLENIRNVEEPKDGDEMEKHEEKTPESTLPPEPPARPPRPGMTLKTVIRNGWVCQEWV